MSSHREALKLSFIFENIKQHQWSGTDRWEKSVNILRTTLIILTSSFLYAFPILVKALEINLKSARFSRPISIPFSHCSIHFWYSFCSKYTAENKFCAIKQTKMKENRYKEKSIIMVFG